MLKTGIFIGILLSQMHKKVCVVPCSGTGWWSRVTLDELEKRSNMLGRIIVVVLTHVVLVVDVIDESVSVSVKVVTFHTADETLCSIFTRAQKSTSIHAYEPTE